MKSGTPLAVITAGLFLFAGSGIYYWSEIKKTPVKEILLRQKGLISREEIVLLMDISEGEAINRQRLGKIKERLMTHPLIKNIDFRLDGSGRLTVDITERKCFAVIRNSENKTEKADKAGRYLTRFYEVDENLFILSQGIRYCSGYPLISGRFPFKNNRFTGLRLKKIAQGLKAIRRKTPNLFHRISEIRPEPGGVTRVYFTGDRFVADVNHFSSKFTARKLYASVAYLESEGHFYGYLNLREKEGIFFR